MEFLSKAKHRFIDTLRQKAMNGRGRNLLRSGDKKDDRALQTALDLLRGVSAAVDQVPQMIGTKSASELVAEELT